MLELELYRQMARLRRLDERCLMLQRQGRIGFYGAATGQEAVVCGAALALAPSDWVFPALREGGMMLVRGYALEKYLSQIFGRTLDASLGRQMPSHAASREVKQVSWSSCIGTQLPHAVGAAWAAQQSGDQVAVLACLGDGATSSPDFHGALNFAGLWRAPVVFLCQNNQYALSVPVSRQTASESFAIKAFAYGFEGVRIDGNDALGVYRTVKESVDRARSGSGPRFIECVTYRLGSHSSSDDPSRYRSDAELEEWRSRDPIPRLRDALTLQGAWSPELEQSLLEGFDVELERAIEKVEAAPFPALSSLFDDVYKKLPWPLNEQRQALLRR